MKLNLNQARRIAGHLEEQVKEISRVNDRFHYGRHERSSEHFTHDDLDSAHAEGEAEIAERVQKALELLEIRATIRDAIDAKNRETGIAELIAEGTILKAEIRFLSTTLNQIKAPSFDSTNNRFSKGCSDSYKATLTIEINSLKRQEQDIADRRAALNANTFIVLSETYASELKKLELVD